jgi:nucleoside phosphorylase
MAQDNQGGSPLSRTEDETLVASPPALTALNFWLSCPDPASFSWERIAQPFDETYGARVSTPALQGGTLFLPVQLSAQALPYLLQDAERGKLDTLVALGGARFVQEIREGTRCLFHHLPPVTFSAPSRFEDVASSELKRLPHVDVVLLTTTDVERNALYEVMKPLPGRSGLVEGARGHNTYRLGQFGRYLAAHVESTMGSQARDGSTLTVRDAIAELSPRAVIILGIAFGLDPIKQRLGDVIIAESVIPYELQRVGVKVSHRGQQLPCGATLSERFRKRRMDWSFRRGEDFVKVFQGPLLSGEKLTDNLMFRDALVEAFPTALGGEMEGAGAYAATERTNVEVILVKAICDWGDGSKTDHAQPFAAKAAVSLAHHILSKRAVLETLGARDYELPGEPSASPAIPISALRPLQATGLKRMPQQPPPEDPTVHTLMGLLQQPFSLLLGGHAEPLVPLIETLVRQMPPGVHVTLQRPRTLEETLARQRPTLPLYVLEPALPGEGQTLVRWHMAGQGWALLDSLPETFDPKREALVLRLYRSPLPGTKFDRASGAEDFLLDRHPLEALLHPEWVDLILSSLYSRPALLLGLSLSARDHKLGLHHLFGHRPLPRRSTALLAPHCPESSAWQTGRELPGCVGIQVIQAEPEDLAQFLDTELEEHA